MEPGTPVKRTDAPHMMLFKLSVKYYLTGKYLVAVRTILQIAIPALVPCLQLAGYRLCGVCVCDAMVAAVSSRSRKLL